MGYKLRWTLWMTAGGIATAVVVFLLTESVGWAVVGLLASGMVFNALFAPRVARSGGARTPLGRR